VVDYPSIEATISTVLTDDAVSVLLASTVPLALQILDDTSGLPGLPQFAISLQGLDAGDSPPLLRWRMPSLKAMCSSMLRCLSRRLNG
jgi:hypothetical protein